MGPVAEIRKRDVPSRRRLVDAQPEDRAPIEHQKPKVLIVDEYGRTTTTDELRRRYMAATAPKGWDAER